MRSELYYAFLCPLTKFIIWNSTDWLQELTDTTNDVSWSRDIVQVIVVQWKARTHTEGICSGYLTKGMCS